VKTLDTQWIAIPTSKVGKGKGGKGEKEIWEIGKLIF